MYVTVIDCFLKLHLLKCPFLRVRFAYGYSTKIKTANIERIICATVVTIKIKREGKSFYAHAGGRKQRIN